VTVGFDGKLGALSRLETRLEEVVRWAFGDLVDLRRAPTGLQPGLALQLTTAES
jgi:hypothetical protein